MLQNVKVTAFTVSELLMKTQQGGGGGGKITHTDTHKHTQAHTLTHTHTHTQNSVNILKIHPFILLVHFYLFR